MKIPFFDLRRQSAAIHEEIEAAIKACLQESMYVGGTQISRFEGEFADWLGAEYCVSCGNGTDALELAMMALGIGKGDEVIVPALSWVSTATSVLQVGATPVFADINPYDYTIDPADVDSKLTEKTRAIIPVHLYGLMAPMHELKSISTANNLYLIEDCAQAHGASLDGKKAGTFGDAAAFSFYPTKNLGAFGDAGAVVTSSVELEKRIREMASVGQSLEKIQVSSGICSRMDTMQAAILRAKLPYLDSWVSKRQELAARYSAAFSAHDQIQVPRIPLGFLHSFYLYVIQIDNRDKLVSDLTSCGIETKIHYPAPLSRMLPFTSQLDELPSVDEVTSRIVSLPLFPELTEEEQDYVIETLIGLI